MFYPIDSDARVDFLEYEIVWSHQAIVPSKQMPDDSVYEMKHLLFI